MLAENRRRGNLERKVMSKIDKSWSQSGLPLLAALAALEEQFTNLLRNVLAKDETCAPPCSHPRPLESSPSPGLTFAVHPSTHPPPFPRFLSSTPCTLSEPSAADPLLDKKGRRMCDYIQLYCRCAARTRTVPSARVLLGDCGPSAGHAECLCDRTRERERERVRDR